jgi:hypothetical protein
VIYVGENSSKSQKSVVASGDTWANGTGHTSLDGAEEKLATFCKE